MKRKHLLLFIISILLLCISDMFAAGLIALALIFQMNILFYQIPLTQASQLAAFKLFLFSIPVYFFLGGIHSFISVYALSGQWLFLIFAISIAFCLFFIANFLSFFCFHYLEANNYQISIAIQKAISDIHRKKKDLLWQTSFLFVVSLVPFLNTEWKIVFALMVMQLYSHRHQLKLVFGSSR